MRLEVEIVIGRDWYEDKVGEKFRVEDGWGRWGMPVYKISYADPESDDSFLLKEDCEVVESEEIQPMLKVVNTVSELVNQPKAELIELLEHYLAEARAGEIRCMGLLVHYAGSDTGNAFIGATCLGEIRALIAESAILQARLTGCISQQDIDLSGADG